MRNTLRYLILPVLNASGPVFMWLAVVMLLPMIVAWTHQEVSLHSFIACVLITFFTGMFLTVATRRYKTELTARHGFLLVTLIWTAVPLFSTIPFFFETPHLSFPKIYFEMMSCLTTTGATVFTGLDDLPMSLNGWRCCLSWMGGMGLIVLSVAILPLLGVGGAQIFKAEASGPLKEQKLTPRIADTAKALYLIYFGISMACAVSYHLAGMNWADAIMHMMTTVSLSGISTHDASYSYFNSPVIDYVAVFFMVVCGFNFALHFVAWHSRNIMNYLHDREAMGWIFTLFGISLLTYLILTDVHYYATWQETLRYTLFSVVSAASTTGFSNSDYSLWPRGLPVLIMISAAFATCAGSTGGGIKQIRVAILFEQLRREFLLLLYPNAVVPLSVGNTKIDNKVSFAVLVYAFLWILTYFVGFMLLLLSGLSSTEALSAPVAMLANLGPGLGSVGPSGNYSGLTGFQLWICSFLMLAGRLELFTVFVLFTKKFWQS